MYESMIGTQTCFDESGSAHTFRYWLITEHLPLGRFSFEDYGIKVDEPGGEIVCIPSITHNRSRIETLLTLLMEHKVSPVNLADVVEDWTNENRLPQMCGRR